MANHMPDHCSAMPAAKSPHRAEKPSSSALSSAFQWKFSTARPILTTFCIASPSGGGRTRLSATSTHLRCLASATLSRRGSVRRNASTQNRPTQLQALLGKTSFPGRRFILWHCIVVSVGRNPLISHCRQKSLKVLKVSGINSAGVSSHAQPCAGR